MGNEATAVQAKPGVKFFGEVDLNKGRLSSQYPAWYNRKMMDDLRESIQRLERSLDRGTVPKDKIGDITMRLKRDSEKLASIEASFPKMSGPDRDKAAKIRSALGEKIRESMFSRSDMVKGVADVHEEARRMTSPVIEVPTEMREMVRSCGVKMGQDGRVSRKGAEKAWKIVSRYLGEASNTEVLRRD